MAAKKNSTASRSSRTSGRGKRQKQNNPTEKKQVRREVFSAVCLFLSVMTLLGLFRVDALLINLLWHFAKGLIGYGAYVIPFSLLYSFVILLLHGGKPVRLRVASSLALAAVVGALIHVFACRETYTWSFSMLGTLYKDGIESACGGLISGFFAILCTDMLSKIGACILFLILFFLFLLFCMNMTVSSLARAIENRPRPEPETTALPKEDTATAIVNHVANRHIERVERKRSAAVDIPIDEEPPRTKTTERRPATQQGKKATSPDEYLRQSTQAVPQPAPTRTETAAVAQQPRAVRKTEEKVISAPIPEPVPEPVLKPEFSVPVPEETVPMPETQPVVEEMPEKVTRAEASAERVAIATEIAAAQKEPENPYVFPALDILSTDAGTVSDGKEEIRTNTERLNATLNSFGIDAHIQNVIRGPSVTRYELELDPGIKLSKVTGLSDDIALALGAASVRISAIPDKISIVGIEVPNRQVSTVPIREVLSSKEFQNHKSRVAFAVGKDIGGAKIVGDIAKLPHMLIAGTTGSGKSVCMNSLIISILYKAKPEEVKMIMVDPKMVELGIYNGIPHLLIPVVTEPKKAAGALQWGVTEMMRRYRLMADAGVRNLEEYNKEADRTGACERLPQIVIVIDELADLMLVAAKEVEESICRVAQMGRASGVHLVIATQRPSADVITGLMKANIPSRIAFAVSSAMESRIILDATGAEKLVGKGDMLYSPLGQGKPLRVQGCLISDAEVASVVEAVKKTSGAQYSEEVQKQIDNAGMDSTVKQTAAEEDPAENEFDGDELLPDAVNVILESGQASVSMLQRRLKLGYARAARIVDQMEEMGIVGPFEGSKPRQILITREEWERRCSGEDESGVQNMPLTEEDFSAEEDVPDEDA